MVYTGATATAAELHAFGSVLRVVPRDELRDRRARGRRRHRREVADGDPRGQGEPQRHRPVGREALATASSRASPSSSTCRACPTSCATRSSTSATPTPPDSTPGARVTDKRMTEEDVVAELRDGMTIGIGGWGSRRKPMSIVRAIARSDVQDLTVVSYGGPRPRPAVRDRQGEEGRSTRSARSTRSRSSRTSATPGSPARCRRWSSTRACSSSGCRPRHGGCRSCRRASASGRSWSTASPRSRPSRRPTTTARSSWPRPL